MTLLEIQEASLDWQDREDERANEERDWCWRCGQLLRASRKARGWTIYDVGALLDVSGVTVSRWERGIHSMNAYQYDRLRREGLLP